MVKKVIDTEKNILVSQGIITSEEYDEVRKKETNAETVKHQINCDVPRMPLVDFNNNFDGFHTEITAQKILDDGTYLQGDFSGRFLEFENTLYVQKLVENESDSKKANEIMHQGATDFDCKGFSYRNDQGKLSSLCIFYQKSDLKNWIIQVNDDILSIPLVDRKIHYFSNGSFAEKGEGDDIPLQNLSSELNKAINSEKLTELVQNIVSDDGKISLIKFNELKKRIHENQNIDNRDVKAEDLEKYKKFANEKLPDHSKIENLFNELDRRAKQDINFYRENNFETTLTQIFETVNEEIDKLPDDAQKKELTQQNLILYYATVAKHQTNFKDNIHQNLFEGRTGTLERMFNDLPTNNDNDFRKYVNDFCQKRIENSGLNFDHFTNIKSKTNSDRGGGDKAEITTANSIFNKNGSLASWVAEELPETLRSDIANFIQTTYAKAENTLFTYNRELHPEFIGAIGEDNYERLVKQHGKEFLHNKILSSMLMAMSGSITSVAEKNSDYLAFTSLASFLLNHERQHRQIKLDEKLKQQNEKPEYSAKIWQAAKRPLKEGATIGTITAGSAAAGSIVGMLVGTFVLPGIGTGLGAGIGAAMGAGAGLAAATTGVGVGRLSSPKILNRLYGTLITTGAATGMGAGIGALLGTFVLPGVGTGIGAAIGAGFGLATGLGISGIAQSLKGKSLLAKLLGQGVTAGATTAIGAGVGAILGTAFPVPGVGTLAGTLIGAGIGAGAGALTTAIPTALGYLGSRVAALVSQKKTDNTSTSNLGNNEIPSNNSNSYNEILEQIPSNNENTNSTTSTPENTEEKNEQQQQNNPPSSQNLVAKTEKKDDEEEKEENNLTLK